MRFVDGYLVGDDGGWMASFPRWLEASFDGSIDILSMSSRVRSRSISALPPALLARSCSI